MPAEVQVWNVLLIDGWVAVYSFILLLQMAHCLLLLLMVFGNSVILGSSQCTEGKEPDVVVAFKPKSELVHVSIHVYCVQSSYSY